MRNERQKAERKIILASASPRRKSLLYQIGLDFEVMISRTEEKITTDIPWKAVEELSRQKALACRDMLAGSGCRNALIIGADTVVAVDGRILGKPSGEQEAADMLSLLQGHSHQVYTGVTLVLFEEEDKPFQVKTFHEVTDVEFYPMSRQEIVDYVRTGEPMDKAGAYGIQGLCARYIRGIRGDYNNVVGLPVARLYQEVRDWL
nr:Maf family protein [uncultured Acetatifactor sp.]